MARTILRDLPIGPMRISPHRVLTSWLAAARAWRYPAVPFPPKKSGTIGTVVWNNRDGWATGGGVSEVFPVPSWQANAKVPKSLNPGGKKGRGVPDVCGDADGETGYRIRVDGFDIITGGTSAVAPLWAGLIARINQKLGKPIGFVNPFLYKTPTNSNAFRDITIGDNAAFSSSKGYKARTGWDPCTGLGSPDGAQLLKDLDA